MATLLSITITDPGLDTKHAEIAYARRALQFVEMELGQGNGNKTSGTILGVNAAGLGGQSLGSWTYSPSATKP